MMKLANRMLRIGGMLVFGILAACDSESDRSAYKRQQSAIADVTLAEFALPNLNLDWRAYVITKLEEGDCQSAIDVLMPVVMSGNAQVQEFGVVFETGGFCGPDYWSLPSAAEVYASYLSAPYEPFEERILTYRYDTAGLIPASRSLMNFAHGIDPDVSHSVREMELTWLQQCEIPMALPYSQYAIVFVIASGSEDRTILDGAWQRRALECSQAATALAAAYESANWEADDDLLVGWLTGLVLSSRQMAEELSTWAFVE